jgi:hypothetical protein
MARPRLSLKKFSNENDDRDYEEASSRAWPVKLFWLVE